MKKFFGKLKNGIDVYTFELKNDFLKVNILNYGGIIKSIHTYDKNKLWGNIVLGYDDLLSYETLSPHFGCITGRTAGRIENAEFRIDEKLYKLKNNDNQHSLHGGVKGLDKKIWDIEKHDDNEILLSYISPDGEEGYPGNLEIKVSYKLENNKLIWTCFAKTDKPTPVNITNHTYFNLSGGECLATTHVLKIDSKYIYPLKENFCPSENKIEVKNTPFDFREEKRIDKDIENSHEQLKIGKGYDHPYLLNNEEYPIELYDELTKRALKIKTNQNVCVFYSGNFLTKNKGKLSIKKECSKHIGIAFETQECPNQIDKILLKPDEEYYSYNEWEFYVKD